MTRSDRWETVEHPPLDAGLAGRGVPAPRDGSRWRRSAATTAIIVGFGLMLASCGELLMSPIGASLCRGVSSWQDAKPVAGCQDGAALWSRIALVLGILLVVLGIVGLVASRPRQPRSRDD